jgi:hypothetical protein
MSEEATGDVTEDPGSHLNPVIDHLAERFTEAGRDHVAEVVWDVYDHLNAEAKVPDHLAALTQHRAKDRLRAESES